jgi:predicted Zn-dependent peptidase
MAANTNWHNAHNFYGDLQHLDAATLEDVRSFFETYYAPNNAVLVVVGDFEPKQTLTWIRKYFEKIPSAPQPPKPDLTEPRQTEEKRAGRVDSLARRPALAVAYHVPPRYTPEWYAFGILDQILAQGRDSRFYEELVRERALTAGVSAGINFGLGNMYNYNGPMLWIASMFHDNDKPADSLIAAIDEAIASVRDVRVDRATLDRALVKLRSSLYSTVEAGAGLGRADLLAAFALFDDDPGRINRLEEEFAKVTPELLQKTAQEYLRPTNRTIYTITPAARAASSSSTGSGQ